MTTFDETLLQILAQRGVVIDSDGRYARVPGYEGPDPVTDAQLRYANERAGKHDVEGVLQRSWVEELAEVSGALSEQDTSAAWYLRTAFWVRLHGVLSDLRSRTVDGLANVGVDPATFVPTPGSLLALQLELHRCIEAVRQQFSEDELIYADYLRQANCHVRQQGYDVRWSNKNGGQVNDRLRIAALGREFAAADLTAAIERVLNSNTVDGRINEHHIASVFARRVHSAIGPLTQIMKRLTTPSR